jgi:hypothetical protein
LVPVRRATGQRLPVATLLVNRGGEFQWIALKITQ